MRMSLVMAISWCRDETSEEGEPCGDSESERRWLGGDGEANDAVCVAVDNDGCVEVSVKTLCTI